MWGWLGFGVGALGGALAAVAWHRGGASECRVLDVEVALEGPVAEGVEGPYLPVGARLVEAGVDAEVLEVHVPVTLPPGTPSRRCEADRPRALSGWPR